MPATAAGALPPALLLPGSSAAPAASGDAALFEALLGAAVGDGSSTSAAPLDAPATLPEAGPRSDAELLPLPDGLEVVDADTGEESVDVADVLLVEGEGDPEAQAGSSEGEPVEDALRLVARDPAATADTPERAAAAEVRAQAADPSPDAETPVSPRSAPSGGDEAAAAPRLDAVGSSPSAGADPEQPARPDVPRSKAPTSFSPPGSSPPASPPPASEPAASPAPVVEVPSSSSSPVPTEASPPSAGLWSPPEPVRARPPRSAEPVRVEASVTSAPLTASAVDAPEGAELPEPLRSFGASDPELLPGSVRLDGVRNARVTVDLGDGEVVRGRVDVRNGEVEVQLHATEEAANRAERRVGELKEALDEKGLKLARFTVEAEEQDRRERRQRRQRTWQSQDEAVGGFFNRRA